MELGLILQSLAFYLFASITVVSAVMVISSRNPVHSVLFLILAFFNSAGLFVILGAEFLAMILVVVYVGAVAVLFMFVVMMLDINFTEMRQGFLQYLPIGALVGGIAFHHIGQTGPRNGSNHDQFRFQHLGAVDDDIVR